ncbi:MAG: hypothetical protein QOH96_1783 [Blastocatellia bacterium]|nr:hypothetical protein [Blastocatellia bacterium]
MSRQLHAIPQLTIEANGEAIAIDEMRTLWEVRVRQELSQPTQCELTFLEPTELLRSSSKFAPGSTLRVSVRGFNSVLFDGQITAVERIYEPSRGREIRIRGYDKLHTLRKRQPVRAHVQVTLVDLITELTSSLGISVEAESSGPVWQRLAQFHQSDFEMFADLAERCGLYFTLRDDTLHLITLEGFGEEIPLKLGESVFEARIEVNAEAVCDSVSTSGWDPLRVEQHEGHAGEPRTGRDIAAEVHATDVGGVGERAIVDESIADDLQADAIAQAALDFCAANAVTLWAVAEGNTALQPGAQVNMQGVDADLSGRYVLTSVDHTFDSVKGFVSVISSSAPARKIRSRAGFAALGVVTHVDDPEGFGRVQAKLPTFNDIETDWMGVVTPGAGLGKGLLAMPDVEDTVLVLFPQGDPAQGIVLGGLYGMWTREEWDWGVDGDAVKRYTLRTPGGQRVRLDDATNTLRLENSDGSYLEMSPEKVVLHAQRDMDIEAPGRTVVIKAKKIDFQKA